MHYSVFVFKTDGVHGLGVTPRQGQVRLANQGQLERLWGKQTATTQGEADKPTGLTCVKLG